VRISSLPCLFLVVFAAFAITPGARAQLPTVAPTNVTPLASCPSGAGFYTTDPNHPMACTQLSISCANTVPITMTYGVANASATKGTIVLFSYGGGEDAASYPGEEQFYAQAYIAAGYQVVQTSWGSDWENTNNGNGGSNGYNIRTAACRPASFLNYVYQNIYTNTLGSAGMCAQGISAGSGAIAFSLAWFGAWRFLDKVSLQSGPVFSDVGQGCDVPAPPQGNGIAMCPASQIDCNGWSTGPNGQPIIASTVYNYQQDAIEAWSGGPAVTGPTCANQTNTTTTWNSAWRQMSIVDFSSTSQPTFNYPATAMTSWLCASDQEGTQNNSGSQGEIFYQQFTSLSQLGNLFYQVNAVNNCMGAEGVSSGAPPPSWVTILQNAGLQPTGANAIVYDMSDSRAGQNELCFRHH
jgi:hypothetical protein